MPKNRFDSPATASQEVPQDPEGRLSDDHLDAIFVTSLTEGPDEEFPDPSLTERIDAELRRGCEHLRHWMTKDGLTREEQNAVIQRTMRHLADIGENDRAHGLARGFQVELPE